MKRILRIGLALLVLCVFPVLGVHRAAAGVSSAPRPVSGVDATVDAGVAHYGL